MLFLRRIIKLDLDLKERNLICKVTFRCKSNGNSIFEVKGYTKIIDARISRINIVVSGYVDKVYAKLNKIFNEIKGASKRAGN